MARCQHNRPGDLWIIIDSNVYDVSKFVSLHPGGESVFYDEDIGILSQRSCPIQIQSLTPYH